MGLAVAGAQTLRTSLFEISTADPFTVGAAAALLVLVSVMACVGPARTAATVDPLTLLRQE